MTTTKLKPILKWAGGKRQLVDVLVELIGEDYGRYVEPFLGGGALFFELQPFNAVINDYNSELINVYKVIRDNPQELVNLLKKHQRNNTKEYFYEVRGYDRNNVLYEKMSEVEKAARTIYLNKTCYNGLYRVNSKGEFSTPYGRYKNPNIVEEKNIFTISDYFNKSKIKIICGDFTEALKYLRKKSLVYFDPPYVPNDNSKSFDGYTDIGFSQEDQIRLKLECDKLTEKGIAFILSNSDVEFVRNLYIKYDQIDVEVRRSIGSKTNSRKIAKELIIHNLDIVRQFNE